MLRAVDLHLHSRYSGAVSPEMTVENIARQAQCKGLDLLGTGDCLQADWLREIEATMQEAERGLLALRPEVEAAVAQRLPAGLRRSLRYVLSTEVCCAPPGTGDREGIHHLVYFPSLGSVRRFREKIARYGDLRDGRPTLQIESWRLLEMVLAHEAGCHLAPAHVFNPWYSTLGTVSGGRSLEAVFDDLAPLLLAVETGLTSTPPMCRRVSSLDRHALYSCSDAHSLKNLGRECTLLDIEPGYAALFAALRSGAKENFIGTLKFPLEYTPYFRNRCGACQEAFDGTGCPRCGGPLVPGSRDRLEAIADRKEPVYPDYAPPFRELLPLAHVLAAFLRVGPESKGVLEFHDRLLRSLGHERFILTEASYEAIAQADTPQLAKVIIGLRTATPRWSPADCSRLPSFA